MMRRSRPWETYISRDAVPFFWLEAARKVGFSFNIRHKPLKDGCTRLGVRSNATSAFVLGSYKIRDEPLPSKESIEGLVTSQCLRTTRGSLSNRRRTVDYMAFVPPAMQYFIASPSSLKTPPPSPLTSSLTSPSLAAYQTLCRSR